MGTGFKTSKPGITYRRIVVLHTVKYGIAYCSPKHKNSKVTESWNKGIFLHCHVNTGSYCRCNAKKNCYIWWRWWEQFKYAENKLRALFQWELIGSPVDNSFHIFGCLYFAFCISMSVFMWWCFCISLLVFLFLMFVFLYFYVCISAFLSTWVHWRVDWVPSQQLGQLSPITVRLLRLPGVQVFRLCICKTQPPAFSSSIFTCYMYCVFALLLGLPGFQVFVVFHEREFFKKVHFHMEYKIPSEYGIQNTLSRGIQNTFKIHWKSYTFKYNTKYILTE